MCVCVLCAVCCVLEGECVLVCVVCSVMEGPTRKVVGKERRRQNLQEIEGERARGRGRVRKREGGRETHTKKERERKKERKKEKKKEKQKMPETACAPSNVSTPVLRKR